MADAPLHQWRATLERAIAGAGAGWIDRVVVLAETDSTQDAARRLGGGRAGLLVVADRQTRGRGRLGRAWDDGHGLALSATLLTPARDGGELALAAGLAALHAARAGLGAGGVSLCLRWPNDVVHRASDRKLAGVLVEGSGGLACVGIGINCLQRAGDFPAGVRGASLAMLGSGATRLDVCVALARSLGWALSLPRDEAASSFAREDCVVGSRRAFVHGGARHEGRVMALDPLGSIRLRTDAGAEVVLPAMATAMEHGTIGATLARGGDAPPSS